MREYAIRLDARYFVGTRYVDEGRWQPSRSTEPVFSPQVSMARRYATHSEAREDAVNLFTGDNAPPSMRVVAIRKVAK